MKKASTIFSVCLCFILTLSTQAQTEQELLLQKQKEAKDIFLKTGNLKGRKPLSFQQHKTTKSSDWYEPETITLYLPNEDPFSRKTFRYNSEGRVTSELLMNWSNSIWIDSERITYTYDDSQNQETTVIEMESFGAWLNSTRYVQTFNEAGNVMESLTQNWEIDTWANASRISYTYHTNGSIDSYLSEKWESENWVSEYRFTYGYNENSNLDTVLMESWVNDTWVNRSRYIYDENEIASSYIIEMWNNGTWEVSNRSIDTYDDGKVILTMLSMWYNNAWIDIVRIDYIYDTDGNCLSEITNFLLTGAISRKILYAYDEFGNCVDMEFMDEYDSYSQFTYNHGESRYTLFDVPQKASITISYINTQDLGVPGYQDINLRCYPNPATHYINIESDNTLQSYRLYNTLGMCVLSGNLENLQEKIDIQNLPAGLYTLRISTENGIVMRKIIKK